MTELWQQVLVMAALALVVSAGVYYLATHRGAQALVVAAGASLLVDLRAALGAYLAAHPLSGADLDPWLDAFGAQLTDARLRAGYAALRPAVRALALEYLAALATPPPPAVRVAAAQRAFIARDCPPEEAAPDG